jgi:hypothetical protein
MCTFATLLFVMVFLFLEWDLENAYVPSSYHHHQLLTSTASGSMSRSGLAIYIKKYLKAKEE